eukprot:scaffold3551_cov408-Prasinococcus_capsulatus_cf.AAC.17
MDHDYGPKYTMRPLALEDYGKGYMRLLGQLTLAGEVSEAQFKLRFEEMFVSAAQQLCRRADVG